MTDRVNMAVIGTGRMGSVHTRNLARKIPEANIAALCDLRLEVAQAIADELGITRDVQEYHALLADPAIQAVLIATPTDTHTMIIEDAARAGKHIFSEKPLSIDLPSIDAALAVVEQAGVKLQVGFNRRFDQSFRRLREVVASGKIGRPCLLRITERDPAPPPISYIKNAGCIFLDLTIHDFDMVRYQMGEVEEVYATGSVLINPEIGEVGDVDTDVVTLRFANGELGLIDNSRQAVYGYDQRLEVLGTTGAVMAGNQMVDTVSQADASGFHSPGLPYFFMHRYAEAYVTEVREFVECVRDDKQPPVTGRDGRLAVVMAHAAIKSWKENRPVKLSEIAVV